MRRILLIGIPVAVVTALVAASSAAAAGSSSSAGAASAVQAGSAGNYSILTPLRTTSPRAIAPGTATGNRPTKPVLVRPALAAPTTKGPAAASARVETITKVSTSGITASPLLVTHDQEVAFNHLDVAPPDTQMATSPLWTFEVVNSLGEIRSRTSTAKTDLDMGAFFGLPVSVAFADPRIIYDASSGRWYLSALTFDSTFDSIVGLAVSSSADPNGTWTIYDILDHSGDHILCDQPHLGFSKDKVTIACDEFNSSSAFLHDVWVTLDKNALVAGTVVHGYTLPYGNGDTAHFSLQPVYSMSSTAPQYLTYINTATTAALIAITGNPANSNVAWSDTTTAMGISAFTTVPPRAPQPGTMATIDTGDIRFDNAVFENGTIWSGSGDVCTPTGDSTARACMRLIQFKTGNWPASGSPSIGQDYDVGANGKYFYYPGIAMDASGTTYVAYSESSSTDFPSVYALDILGATPGSVDTDVLVMVGAGAYTTGPVNSGLGGQRWGDYSGAAPDPNDAHTVLLSGELSAFESSHTNDWGTVAATFNIPGCATVNISTGTASPMYPGPTVVFTSQATGCYGTPQFRFWKQRPGAAWTIVQDYSASNTFNWNTGAETTLGTYKFEVDARSGGSSVSYDVTANTSFILASPATCTIGDTFTPPTPGATGTSVLIQASSNCPDPIYRFWIKPPGGSWTVVQAYSAASSYNWTSTSTPGAYGVEVDVKDRLDPPSLYGFYFTSTYTLQACSAVDFSANPPSSQPGPTVVVTATSTCIGTPVYRFWVQAPGGAWTVTQNYSTSNIFNWSTAGLAQGMYGLEVDVKNQGSTVSYEAAKSAMYRLSVPACTTPTLVASPASPGPTGGPILLNATTTACPNAQFRFWVQSPPGMWSKVQDYSATNTFTWAPSTAGGYHIEVDVRDQAEPTVSYDAVFTIPYQVNACSGVTLGTNPNSPQYPAGSVVLTGTATCTGGTATYRFWTKSPTGPWTIARDYNTTNTFSWVLDGLTTGAYGLEVDVRNQNSTAGYEAHANTTYVLQAAPCTTPTLGASPTSPGPTGGTITFTASTSGCTNAVYRFWVQGLNGVWTKVQDYGNAAGNVFTWTGTGHAGLYHVEVDVRDRAETSSYDAVSTIPYTLGGCTAVSIATSPSGTAAHGTTVTITATATCPGTATYRFWIKAPGGAWTIVQDYSTTNTFTWTSSTTPINTNAAGAYSIEVDVRDNGSLESYEKVNSTTYTLT